MSLDVSLYIPSNDLGKDDICVFTTNITSNLVQMAKKIIHINYFGDPKNLE